MRSWKAAGLATFVLVALISTVGSAWAQITTGSLTGTIVDPQGAVVAGATVTLVSDTQGTKSAPVTTGSSGDFVLPNITPGVYTVQVERPGFKPLKQSGVTVSAGGRLALGKLTVSLEGVSAAVDVTAEAPLVQSATGERSAVINQIQIENLPISNRNFLALASLAPGVDGTDRLGGGGGNNIMIDGVTVMDPGATNAVGLAVARESIAEVKVLTSGYQAEYGRASGLQITAVTKSGSNRFHGAVYDVERDSDWNNNSKTNILNLQPKAVSKARDWGYSIGGPIGKPGGDNKLFFFHSLEFNPRTQGGNTVQYRMPTELERQGDFSQSYDNLGNLYPYIRNPYLPGAASTCSVTNQSTCYAADGVVGRIPQGINPATGKPYLYDIGLKVLNWWPLPTIKGAAAAGLNYNYELVRPIEKATGKGMVFRFDYQHSPSLRLSVKRSSYDQNQTVFVGNLPGFTDTQMTRPLVPSWLYSVNYTMTPSTFFEMSYGTVSYEQQGCAFAGGGSPAPSFCNNSVAIAPRSDIAAAGFGNIPRIYPNALVLPQDYMITEIFNEIQPPYWDGTRINRAPTFSFGNRVSNQPPAVPFAGFFQRGGTHDISASITKIVGQHSFKTGYYFQRELHDRNGGGNAFGTLNFQQDGFGTNPFDTSFGYANAATGAFSQYSQATSYLEGHFVYYQNEAYVQDNWKVSPRLTLDYGMRFVSQQPYHDERGQAANFLPDRWTAANAPYLYAPGCVNNANPCSGTNRQAKHPITNQLLGINTTNAIGTIVPGLGVTDNGMVLSGQGISKNTYEWPKLAMAPRFGVAYDVNGSQGLVVRGAVGLYYDRPSGNAAGTYNMIGNPPKQSQVSVRYGRLEDFGANGLTTTGAPALTTYEYKSKLPASTQWNAGVQMVLPWASTFDVSYVGQHAYDQIETVNINSIDLGAGFLLSAQDPTVTLSAIPGTSSFVTSNPDILRSFRGYGNINHRMALGWRTYHSLQFSLKRNFHNGFQLGFTDTWSLSDKQNAPIRIEHVGGPGTFSIRADQGAADKLLGDNSPTAHRMRADFVWDLPDLHPAGGVMKSIALVANDWQLSGVWAGATGGKYDIVFNYQDGTNANVNLTGSPNYSARTVLIGTPKGGCSDDVYRQFDTTAFKGPAINSVGLESGNGYLTGCFSSVFDLAIARNIKLGGSRNLQLRVDMFNAPNQGRITSRITNMNLQSTSAPTTITNLPFDTTGTGANTVDGQPGGLLTNRVRPNQAGFGAVSGYQGPRNLQAQVRFSF